MKNIAVTVSDRTYRQARVWAAQRDTSVSAVVRHLLDTLPGIKRVQEAFPVGKSNSTAPAAPSPQAN